MFQKYPKTFRILVPEVNVKGKHYLSDEELKLLLAGEVSITEKIDGANVGIIRTKDGFRLQKRGSLVGENEHEQFNFFKAWAQLNYDKLIKLPRNSVLFGELMYAKHTIFYNRLPDYFLAFALYDYKDDEYYSRDQMVEICNNAGLCYAPEIARGHFKKVELFKLIPNVSHFGDEKAEGIIVEKLKDGSRGKLVREEFVKHMEENDHWIHNAVIKNLLRK